MSAISFERAEVHASRAAAFCASRCADSWRRRSTVASKSLVNCCTEDGVDDEDDDDDDDEEEKTPLLLKEERLKTAAAATPAGGGGTDGANSSKVASESPASRWPSPPGLRLLPSPLVTPLLGPSACAPAALAVVLLFAATPRFEVGALAVVLLLLPVRAKLVCHHVDTLATAFATSSDTSVLLLAVLLLLPLLSPLSVLLLAALLSIAAPPLLLLVLLLVLPNNDGITNASTETPRKAFKGSFFSARLFMSGSAAPAAAAAVDALPLIPAALTLAPPTVAPLPLPLPPPAFVLLLLMSPEVPPSGGTAVCKPTPPLPPPPAAAWLDIRFPLLSRKLSRSFKSWSKLLLRLWDLPNCPLPPVPRPPLPRRPFPPPLPPPLPLLLPPLLPLLLPRPLGLPPRWPDS